MAHRDFAMKIDELFQCNEGLFGKVARTKVNKGNKICWRHPMIKACFRERCGNLMPWIA